MTQLQRDIDALISIMEHGKLGFPVRFGYVENPDARSADLYSRSDKEDIDHLKDLFSEADEDSRIAIVYLLRGQERYHGCWAAASRDFCDEKIAGVVVLDQTLFRMSMKHELGRPTWEKIKRMRFRHKFEELKDDISALERLLLDELPQDLWDANLPIMFDEGGALPEYSKTSKKLEFAGDFSFVDCQTFGEQERCGMIFRHNGDWSSYMPVYDVTNTAYAQAAVDVIFARLAEKSASNCSSLLHSAHITSGKDFSFSEILVIANRVCPGSINDSLFNLADNIVKSKRVPEVKEVATKPYAVFFDRSTDKSITKFKGDTTRIQEIFQIIEEVCLDEGVERGNQTSSNKTLAIAEYIKMLSDKFGFASRIEALCAGVPLDDVLADVFPGEPKCHLKKACSALGFTTCSSCHVKDNFWL